jgi:hypothetical protein
MSVRADYTGELEFIDTVMLLKVDHEVAPKEQALRRCDDCHTSGKVDWQASGWTAHPVDGGTRPDIVRWLPASHDPVRPQLLRRHIKARKRACPFAPMCSHASESWFDRNTRGKSQKASTQRAATLRACRQTATLGHANA